MADKQKFAQLFNMEFSNLLASGMDKSLAAATALTKVNELIKNNSTHTGTLEKCDSDDKECKAVPENLSDFRMNSTLLKELLVSSEKSNNYTEVIKKLGYFYSSYSLLSDNFDVNTVCAHDTEISANPPPATTTNSIAININEVTACYSLLFSSGIESVVSSLTHALETLSLNLCQSAPTIVIDTNESSSASSSCKPSALIPFIVLLMHPNLLDPIMFGVLKNTLHAIDSLPENSQRLISQWVGTSEGRAHWKHFVEVLQQYLTLKLLDSEVEESKITVRVMSLIYIEFDVFSCGKLSNQGRSASDLCYEDFCNGTLNDDYLKTKIGLRNEFHLWLLDIKKCKLVIKQRELEEEKRSLAIQHEQQRVFLEAQQLQQTLLDRQKVELMNLQTQLRTLESTRPAMASNDQISELQGLQQRLRSLDDSINQQRAMLSRHVLGVTALATESSSSNPMDVDGSGATVPLTSTAPAVTGVTPPATSTTPAVVGVTPPVTSSASPIPARKFLESAPLFPFVDRPSANLSVAERVPYLRKESFLSYPFLLTPATKSEIVEVEVAKQVNEGLIHDIEVARSRGEVYIIPYLVLQVRRSQLVTDTLNQILAVELSVEGRTNEAKQAELARAFKKPLKVIFDGEEGVDAGGVRKEYYQLLTKQLMDPVTGMFVLDEESQLLWFNGNSFENCSEFELIGLMIGIAIYNSVIIDLRMPMALYKKLKGRKTDVYDLMQLKPSVGKSLLSILRCEGDIEEIFPGLAFELTVESFGEKVTVELIPGGSNTAVTSSNKHDYVKRYVDYVLNESVKDVFDAFSRGFRKVCNTQSMNLFRYDELELLICGNPTLDMSELKKGATYQDGYAENSAVIQYFWVVVMAFDEVEKKMLLKFITGSDRAPIDGLSAVNLVISRIGSNDDNADTRLPSAHTCFNHLLLPEYTTIECLRAKLAYAIHHSEGFGLR